MNIGYARCSTKEQNLDLQLDALKAAGCEKIYSDVASGGKIDRPELEKCIKFLQSGDTLIVWKIDRLSRTLHQLVNTIHDFSLKNIGFKVLTAPIDTTTAQGKLIFGIFASLAEFERSLIKERVNAGIAAAYVAGAVGRPPLQNFVGRVGLRSRRGVQKPFRSAPFDKGVHLLRGFVVS